MIAKILLRKSESTKGESYVKPALAVFPNCSALLHI